MAIMEQIEVRIEPATRGFTKGQPSGRGELRGWLALPDDEGFDPISLLFAVDAFPPATFDVEFAGWVPTLELTAYVRALPAARAGCRSCSAPSSSKPGASMRSATSGTVPAVSWLKARNWPESAWDERQAIGNSTH